MIPRAVATLAGGVPLGACVGTPPAEPSPAADGLPAEPTAAHAEQGPAEGFASREDETRRYIERLPDREFTETCGGEEHLRTWYTAAEELGRIGARDPASRAAPRLR